MLTYSLFSGIAHPILNTMWSVLNLYLLNLESHKFYLILFKGFV